MTGFDPSGTGSYRDGLFGVPTSEKNAKVVIIPVPWEVTTSYGGGTAEGPGAVLQASPQIDLFDLELGDAYEKGYHLLPIPEEVAALNKKLRPHALEVREALESGSELTADQKKIRDEINAACAVMCDWVFGHAKQILSRGQIPAVLGGDHSSPEGNIRAVSEAHKGEIGVLHVDAHADLRFQYQGFQRSHASIMNNVMMAAWKPKKLVQVGIRDFSREEHSMIQERPDIETFFDADIKRRLFEGETWKNVCDAIMNELPKNVYVSFDIDGLSPEFCPGTGTPVPGGLSFDQAAYLLASLKRTGKKIVGFDLNEVAPQEGTEWDGNVGARLLYKMCGWTVLTQ